MKTWYFLYWIFAGDLGGALSGRMIDWKRFLGLVMWYQLGPDTDLPFIFSTYEQLMEDHKAPEPIPKYVEERALGNSSHFYSHSYDTVFYLMLLHAKQGTEDAVDTRKMLCSAASTFDWLDHRLGWHQQGILHAVRALESQQLHDLHMNFASQLLAAGLCHWALYVVLHMPWLPEHPGLHEKVSLLDIGYMVES